MLTTILLLALGFVALYFGAEWLVEGAADIARHLNISKTVVGLTLVAFGTSAPELFVNLIAGWNGHSEFALANIAGSNLTNYCLGFGISALLVVVPVMRREFGIDLVVAAVGPLLVVGSFLWVRPMGLAQWMLVPLGIVLAAYLLTLFRRFPATEAEDPTHVTLLKPSLLFAAGVAALYVGGQLVFDRATQLARSWQLEEELIGLTIVACGTSIPDVMATIVASRRREFSIAVGNILGSNISNVFVVLTGTLLISGQGLPADRGLLVDYLAVMVLSLVVAVACLLRGRITRSMGLVLLGLFAVYGIARIGWLVG